MFASISSSATSTASCGSRRFTIGHNNNNGETEVWICSRSLEKLGSLRSSFESKSNSNEGKITTEANLNVKNPVYKHWILVFKLPSGNTYYMEAFKDTNTGLLDADVKDGEPEDVEGKRLLGTVPLSFKEILKLFTNNKLVGTKYSLLGANCQSWIKGILKELNYEGDLEESINDALIETGSAAVAGFAIGAGIAVVAGAPLVVGGFLASGSASGSASSQRACKSGFLSSLKSKKA